MTELPEPTLIEFFHYNRWANQQLLAICAGLPEELITAPIPGSYGSIHATFVHILRAQISFLRRIGATLPELTFSWEDPPTLQQLAEYEAQLSAALLVMLQHVDPTHQVREQGNGWTFDYQARLIFMSVVYHGIAHRTDISTALNTHGIALPELDVWGYQAAYPDRFQARIVRQDG